jgi:hypothetical protein
MSSADDDKSRDNKVPDANKKETIKEVSLKVSEAEQRDVGRKIARVDPEVIERLDITSPKLYTKYLVMSIFKAGLFIG